jgi:hypothetical protein
MPLDGEIQFGQTVLQPIDHFVDVLAVKGVRVHAGEGGQFGDELVKARGEVGEDIVCSHRFASEFRARIMVLLDFVRSFVSFGCC